MLRLGVRKRPSCVFQLHELLIRWDGHWFLPFSLPPMMTLMRKRKTIFVQIEKVHGGLTMIFSVPQSFGWQKASSRTKPHATHSHTPHKTTCHTQPHATTRYHNAKLHAKQSIVQNYTALLLQITARLRNARALVHRVPQIVEGLVSRDWSPSLSRVFDHFSLGNHTKRLGYWTGDLYLTFSTFLPG